MKKKKISVNLIIIVRFVFIAKYSILYYTRFVYIVLELLVLKLFLGNTLNNQYGNPPYKCKNKQRTHSTRLIVVISIVDENRTTTYKISFSTYIWSGSQK